MAWADLRVAVFGFMGVVVGGYITSCSSEKVAVAQIQSQQKLATSEAALKLIEYRSAPMADIYAANSKMQSASYRDVDEAARQLAVASAIAAARIGGEVGNACRELSSMAAMYAMTPIEGGALKFDQAGKVGSKVAEVMIAFDKSQKGLYEKVISTGP